MSAPNFTIAGPQLPLHETRTSTRTPGEEYNKLVPQQIENLDEQRANEEQQIADTKVQIGREKDIAKAEAAIAQEQADEQGRQMAYREQRAAEADKAVGVWRNRLEGAYQAALKAPTPSLWADKTTGESVMRTIGALFLGALADGASASVAAAQGRAPGPSTIDQIVGMDLDRQRANIERLKDNVVTARTGVKDAEEARRLMLAEVDAKGAAIYKRLESIGKARLAALKADQVTIDNDPRLAEIRQKGIAYRGQAVQGLYDKFQKPTTDVEEVNRDETPKPKTPSAEAGKLDIQQTRIRDNGEELLPDIAALTPKERQDIQAIMKTSAWTDKNVGVDALLSMTGFDKEGSTTERVRRVLRNAGEVYDAAITMDTGAVAAPDQVRNKIRLLIPGPAATANDVKFTTHKLRQLIDNYGRTRGTGAETPPGTVQPPAGDSTAAGGAVHGTRDTRRDADSQPSYSPAGPAVETKANNPDDPNLSTPLPEAPDADSLPEATKAPRGRGKLPYTPSGKSTAQLPPVATPTAPPSVREKTIAFLKANPAVKATSSGKAMMEKLNITEADLGR
jgi:hypothetical protein